MKGEARRVGTDGPPQNEPTSASYTPGSASEKRAPCGCRIALRQMSRAERRAYKRRTGKEADVVFVHGDGCLFGSGLADSMPADSPRERPLRGGR